MALTTAAVTPAATVNQPFTIANVRARRVTLTFTAGYDSTTGVTVPHSAVGVGEIVAVIPEGTANTGAALQVAVANGDATVTLYNGTTKVLTSDQSATTANVLVIGH